MTWFGVYCLLAALAVGFASVRLHARRLRAHA